MKVQANITNLHAGNSSLVVAFDPALRDLRIVYLIATKYSWIPIVIIGLFGNAMSIAITLQRENRRISTCNYMTGLALADSMVLIEYIWSMLVLFYGTHPPSEFVVQLMWYQAFAFGILSGFYLAEMTVDRLIVVRFPMAAPRYCTTRRACVTMVVTFVLICGLNLYIFYTFREFKSEEGLNIIRMSVPENPALEVLGNTAQLVIGTVLPFIIIIICNVWIVIVLRTASKQRGMMGVSKESQKTQKEETAYLTRMLILVTIAYVLTSIPYRLYDVIIGFEEVTYEYKMNEEYWMLRFYSQDFIMANIWIMNYGVNFYLYCIGGGKKYRSDVKQRLLQIFFCCKKFE